MTSTHPLSDQLQTAIDLAQAVESHPDAQQAFQALMTTLQSQNPQVALLFEQLWGEYISSQRSSLFWQQISQVEKRLSDRLTESHIQLKQNYLRLMQEQ